jgi:uncharacterized protein (DUF58 family)
MGLAELDPPYTCGVSDFRSRKLVKTPWVKTASTSLSVRCAIGRRRRAAPNRPHPPHLWALAPPPSRPAFLSSTDFAEFRPYAKGDDIRLLDWRHYARSDRYYVKRYDDETNLQALVIVDTSGSMNFGLSTVSKWRYAQMAAASLAHLLLRQRDSVGLALVGQHLLDFVKPQPRANHLARLLDLLGSAQPAGPSDIASVLMELTGRLKRRGMVVFISDCFGDVPALKHSLEQFCLRGHDVMVAQILAPEELTFPFRREAFFQDLELHRRMQVNPNTVRKAYLKEFQAFMDQLRTATNDVGVDLMTFSTADDLGEVLAYHLRRRAAMKNPHRATVRA